MSAMPPHKSSQAQIDYARAWNLAHPEIVKANKRKSYYKHRPPLKPVETIHQRFDRLYIPVSESGCWLWLGTITKSGYGSTHWKKHNWRAHRLSWTLFKGEIPETLYVLHRCDVASCVNPDHLFLGTVQDNADDMWSKGRRSTILSDDDVRAIRSMKGTVKNKVIASQFGVSTVHISHILTGRKWKEIT